MKRILVIEDDLAILRGLKDNLEYESYEVLTATDGEKGRDLIAEKKPDLIILDLMLPKMSGYELCRQIHHMVIQIDILKVKVSSHGLCNLLLVHDTHLYQSIAQTTMRTVRKLNRVIELLLTNRSPGQ